MRDWLDAWDDWEAGLVSLHDGGDKVALSYPGPARV
jgi:hypothetical protein